MMRPREKTNADMAAILAVHQANGDFSAGG